MAENLQHEDFGEKIGGAKKDLWKDRGLYVDDLGAMNEREAEKFVKKDNVWKKPDYQAMLDDGVPLGVVYFIKKARDSLGASPQYRYSDKTPELRRARQEEYIETVRQLQAVIEDVRTLDDAMQAYDRFLIQNGYVEQVQGWASGTHYRATKKSLDNPVITNKLVQALHIRSASHFDRDFTQKAQQEQFGVSKDQKMPKGYAIHFNDGKNTYSSRNPAISTKNHCNVKCMVYIGSGISILINAPTAISAAKSAHVVSSFVFNFIFARSFVLLNIHAIITSFSKKEKPSSMKLTFLCSFRCDSKH